MILCGMPRVMGELHKIYMHIKCVDYIYSSRELYVHTHMWDNSNPSHEHLRHSLVLGTHGRAI